MFNSKRNFNSKLIGCERTGEKEKMKNEFGNTMRLAATSSTMEKKGKPTDNEEYLYKASWTIQRDSEIKAEIQLDHIPEQGLHMSKRKTCISLSFYFFPEEKLETENVFEYSKKKQSLGKIYGSNW